MSLMAKKKAKSNIPPLEGGTYIAVCVGVVDLGEQPSEKFKNYSDKVLFIFEIPSETVDVDGEAKPRWLSKEFTVSLNEKSNLYSTLVSWRGKSLSDSELENGFPLYTMINQGCQLQVIEVDKDDAHFNNITAIIGLPKGFQTPTAQSEILRFDIDEWSDDIFNKLPEWIQNKIKKSTQYRTKSTGTTKLEFPPDAEVQPAAAPVQPKTERSPAF